ncbi:MAG TPA: cytochrome c family protein [Actinomycetota bacterium]|nr:cytochrome c family protein [Actinomycetota bacterium]
MAVLACALAVALPCLALAQSSDAGKQVFAQCSPCHSIDGSNGVGPRLSGVVGRKAGSVAGFRYSRAMKGSNVVWDDKALDAYVADPQKAIPGNLMPFAGVADAKQRADLIAYLQTLK